MSRRHAGIAVCKGIDLHHSLLLGQVSRGALVKSKEIHTHRVCSLSDELERVGLGSELHYA
jgi:hypothetical protein